MKPAALGKTIRVGASVALTVLALAGCSKPISSPTDKAAQDNSRPDIHKLWQTSETLDAGSMIEQLDLTSPETALDTQQATFKLADNHQVVFVVQFKYPYSFEGKTLTEHPGTITKLQYQMDGAPIKESDLPPDIKKLDISKGAKQDAAEEGDCNVVELTETSLTIDDGDGTKQYQIATNPSP